MTFTKDDVIVYLENSPSTIFDASGNEIGVGKLPEDYSAQELFISEEVFEDSDKPLYTVDMRFYLTNEAANRIIGSLPPDRYFCVDGEHVKVGVLYNNLEKYNIGGSYATFNIYDDGRVIMDDSGFIQFFNGSGDFIDMPPLGMDAIENAFREAAGGKDAFRTFMLKSCNMEYGISSAYMRLEIPQDKTENLYEVISDKIKDAVGSLDAKNISRLFPEADMTDLNAGWKDGLVQKIEIDGDWRELYLGLYCEGENYKEQMIDSPLTLQAMLDDEVVFCKSIEMNIEKEVLEPEI